MSLQVCLVSEQLQPNALGILHQRPRKVICICTQAMGANGVEARLREFLAEEGIAYESRSCPDETDIEGLREAAMELAAELEGQGEAVINLTGGTKLMALAFFELFGGEGFQRIYVDTRRNRVLHLGPQPRIEPLRSLLNVKRVLKLQGGRIDRTAAPLGAAYREAAEFLTQLAGLGERAGPVYAGLHAVARQAMDASGRKLLKPNQRFDHAPDARIVEALEALHGHDLRWDSASRGVHFQSIEAARFLNGGWLEKRIEDAAHAAGLHDAAAGVEVLWSGLAAGQPARNEFDLLVTYRNHALVIEAKASLDVENASKGSGFVHKLVALSETAAGHFAERWLVTAQPVEPQVRKLAQSLRVVLVAGNDLAGLQRRFASWKQSIDDAAFDPPT